ncbi:bestrophin family protein [uncultured Eudoraea sp.]|uniref:bestrophin family protein n=1 Tax=uncultured Eudoraea sp. TaxID=1035614 RepID=UPI00261DDDC0|nr:bestrophin family ion channel [uncultured Eudoraea sp.]
MILEKRIPLRYWLKEIKWDLLIVSVFSIIIYFFKLYIINLEIPISIGAFLGTAIALLLSFKLSQSYDRWWEARKIWGAIVNDSRTFVIQLKQFCKESDQGTIKTMAYRQIGWCYALGQYLRRQPMMDPLENFISEDELLVVKGKKHIPLTLLDHNAQSVRSLYKANSINDFQQIQLDRTLLNLTASMGMAERIKNTVFPRTYRNVLHFFIYIFLLLLSLALESVYGFLEVPILILISIPFFMLEKIAFVIQDPFENKPTDTAMTSIARAIEINIKELLEEEELPEPTKDNGYYIM